MQPALLITAPPSLPSRSIASLCLDGFLHEMGPTLLGRVRGLNGLIGALVARTWEARDKARHSWVRFTF